MMLRLSAGSLLAPSVVQGAQVVLASYESLLSPGCLCRPLRRHREKHGRQQPQQQLQQGSKPPNLLHDDALAGQDEDPVFCVGSSSSGSSDVETRNPAGSHEPPWFSPRTPRSSPRNSGYACDLEDPNFGPSPHSAFHRKLNSGRNVPVRTPESVSSGPRKGSSTSENHCAFPHPASAPHIPRRTAVALWGPRGPRCSCVRCFLVGLRWERLVLDEAHLVCRRRRLARAIKAISAPYRWGLTATPDSSVGSNADDPTSLWRLLGVLGVEVETEEKAKIVTIGKCCCASTPAEAACRGREADTEGHGTHEAEGERRFMLRRTHTDLKERHADGQRMCETARNVLRKMQIEVPIRRPFLPTVHITIQQLSFTFPREMETYRGVEETATRQLAFGGREGGVATVKPLEWVMRLRQACLHFSLVPGENIEEGNAPQSRPICLTDCVSGREDSPILPSVQRRRRLSLRSHGHRPEIQSQVGIEILQHDQVCVSGRRPAATGSKPTQSTKTQAILFAVARILDGNSDAKIVILSAFTSFLALLESHLTEFFRARYTANLAVGSRMVKITGDTSVASRARIIRKFKVERNIHVLLVSALSASYGVDGLQAAGKLSYAGFALMELSAITPTQCAFRTELYTMDFIYPI